MSSGDALQLELRAPRRSGLLLRLQERIDRHALAILGLPALVVMLGVTAVPFVLTIGMSLTDYNLVISGWKFIGISNFVQIFQDSQTPTILLNTLYIVVGLTIIAVGFGLGLATLMDTSFPVVRFIRTLYMLPIMTAGIVVAITWRAMLNNSAGWVNYFLSILHLPQPVWLGDSTFAIPSVLLATAWTAIPFQAFILYTGLMTVPMDLKESAMTEGAGPARVFWHITLPSIRPVLFIAIILQLIDSFRIFEQIQVLTTGGPGIASTPLNIQVYNVGLIYNRLGYASAFGVLLVIIVAASVGSVALLFRKVS